MKQRVTALMAVGFSVTLLPGAAGAAHSDSAIVAVTVFPDRAGITREVSLELKSGSQTVEIGPLPSQVDPGSVSAKGLGESDVTLYGVRLVTKQLEAAQDPKVKTLEEEIKTLTRRQAALNDTKQILEQERAYLASIQAASSEQIGKDLVTKGPKADEAAALLAFLDEAFLKNAARAQETSSALEESGQQLDKLRRELAQLTQGRYRQETSLFVDLEAKKSGAFHLQVSYRLPGASWQPSYEARATGTGSELEFASSALVRQQTGEDWTNVALTLSTAKPAIAGSMPELEPWFLRPWEPVPMRQNRREVGLMKNAALGLEEAKDANKEDAIDGVYPVSAPAELQQATLAEAIVDTAGPSVTFRLPKPASIPADWQPHKVPIGSQRLAAALAYEATPRLIPLAFLRAKVTNTTEALYLAGPVSVFLDGAFVATASLKQVAPGETFDLYLGADERVKVERRQLKERVEVSLLPGLRGKTRSTEYEFLTILENFTGRKIEVTVFDQVPVSEREEIIVESVKLTPAGVEKDEEKPGVFRWVLELSPNQKQELGVSYRVRHPVDLQVR